MANKSDSGANTTAESQAETLPANADAPGNAEVQEAMSTAVDQGYFGVKVDPADNETYTVAGVLKDANK